MSVDWLSVLTLPAVWSFVAAGLGAYLGPYLRKKGENLATKEDLQIVVDQVRVVTKTTEEIKANISNAVWDRQKQWEIKKEALFDALRAVGALQSSLAGLYAVYSVSMQLAQPAQMKSKRLKSYSKAYDDFARALGVAATVCNQDVDTCLGQLLVIAAKSGMAATEANAAECGAQIDQFKQTVGKLRAAVRVDLGLHVE